MLRSSALLGLAALAQAETVTKTPALGYGSPTANAFDQDNVVFTYDLKEWAVDKDMPTQKPAQDTWQQVLAFKIEKDTAGGTTSLGVSWSGGSSASTKQMTAGPETQWFCKSAGEGSIDRAWMSSGISVNIGVSCTASNTCTNSADPTGLGLTGADFRVTGFFYRIDKSSTGPVEGWGQAACAGWCWDATNERIKDSCRDSNTNILGTPWMSVDPVYRDGLSEAFTATWETLNGGLSGDVRNNGWQTAPVRVSNNDEWLVGNQMVLDASSVTTQGLYSRISGQGVGGNKATYMWCFTSSQNWGMRPNGNYRYSANDLWDGSAGACDLGCYPEAADGSCMKPTGLSIDPSLMDYKINWNGVTNNDYTIIASVLVSDNSFSGGNSPSDWLSPNHMVCFAWGHQCSGASTAGPSAVLAMAALYLASRA